MVSDYTDYCENCKHEGHWHGYFSPYACMHTDCDCMSFNRLSAIELSVVIKADCDKCDHHQSVHDGINGECLGYVKGHFDCPCLSFVSKTMCSCGNLIADHFDNSEIDAKHEIWLSDLIKKTYKETKWATKLRWTITNSINDIIDWMKSMVSRL
jgi:hypothetical protein